MLSFQTFTSLVQLAGAALQGAATSLLDLTVGSVLRALLEATASLVMWLQWLLLLLMQRQRLSTAIGPDADSWLADFGLTRLPAIAASGLVTFGRLTATTSATVPLGATVQTADTTRTYAVTEDTTNAAWSATLGAYVLPAGTASVNLPVAAQTAGSVGNVAAGAISLSAVALPGIDYVTNAAALTNGVDAETDAAFKARFPNYLASLACGTLAAVLAAAYGVQQGLSVAVAVNVDTLGNALPGNFVVTVDDGTGSPPSSLLSTVYTAINAKRAACETFSVQAPSVLDVTITLTLTVAAGTVKATLLAPVATAITAFVDALPIGSVLPFSRIAQIAYGVNAAITNVSAVLVNGATADVGGGVGQVVKASSVVVS